MRPGVGTGRRNALPNKAVPIPAWACLREATAISATAAGTRSADATTVASDRTVGALDTATADSGLAFRFHPPDLLPHRGLVAGGPLSPWAITPFSMCCGPPLR